MVRTGLRRRLLRAGLICALVLPVVATASIDDLTEADLGISQLPSTTRVVGRTAVSYEITVFNKGPELARFVRILKRLAPGERYVGAAGAGWQCDLVGADVRCDAGSDMPRGGRSTVTLTIETPPVPAVLSEPVSVGAAVYDPNLLDNETRSYVLSSVVVPIEAGGQATMLVVSPGLRKVGP